MKIKSKSILAATLFAFFALINSGCAALFNSGGGKVTFGSNPSGAEIIVDGQTMGITPSVLHLDRSTSHNVTIKKDGKERSFAISNNLGGGWIILDLFAGLIPLLVDAATGSWYSLSPQNINVSLD